MADPKIADAETTRALRAEHDELAARLATRFSVDDLRQAAYGGFATIISLALALKFAWDRWGWSKLPKPPVRGRYPLLFLGALLLFAALAGWTLATARRALRRRREEEALHVRFIALRKELELDP
jgi:hypothetical protein